MLTLHPIHVTISRALGLSDVAPEQASDTWAHQGIGRRPTARERSELTQVDRIVSVVLDGRVYTD